MLILDVIISTKTIEVNVFAEYVNEASKVIKKKVYDFNYPVEFPITDDTLGKLDLTEAGVKESNDPLQTLRKYLYDAKHNLPQAEENLPVYTRLDVLTSHVKKQIDNWFNKMISRQIATTGREIATLDDVLNFCDCHSQMLKFNPNIDACYYMLGDIIQKPIIKSYSSIGITKLIIAARDKMRQKWKEILYIYIMNYFQSSIKMRDILRIEKFGQHLPPLDEDETIHYLIMNICDLQYITWTRFHATLRREFLNLIFTLRKTRTMKPSDLAFRAEIYMFMETFVRAALYRKFHHYHQYVDWCMLLYPKVCTLKKFIAREKKISKETIVKHEKRLAYKQFLLVWEIGRGLYHKGKEKKTYEDSKAKNHCEKTRHIYAEEGLIKKPREFPILTKEDLDILRNPSMSIQRIALDEGKNEITEQEYNEDEDHDMIDSNYSASEADVNGLRMCLSSMDINRSKEAYNEEELTRTRRLYVGRYHEVIKHLTKGTRFDPNKSKRSALVLEELDQEMRGSSNNEEENN